MTGQRDLKTESPEQAPSVVPRAQRVTPKGEDKEINEPNKSGLIWNYLHISYMGCFLF